MSGNVYEWCNDLYKAYLSNAQTDPQVPDSEPRRVFRGGCWSNNWKYVRVSIRGSETPYERDYRLGFRLVCDSK